MITDAYFISSEARAVLSLSDLLPLFFSASNTNVHSRCQNPV